MIAHHITIAAALFFGGTTFGSVVAWIFCSIMRDVKRADAELERNDDDRPTVYRVRR